MENVASQQPNSEPAEVVKKRRANFLGFRIVEEDKVLIEYLEAPHQVVLNMTGSYKAISSALNIPEGTVRSRLHRARAALASLREQLRSGEARPTVKGTNAQGI